jgi:hypothetical protein
MIDLPATPVSGAEVVIERRVGEAGNRGLSPVVRPVVLRLLHVEAAQAQKAVGAQRILGICKPMENHPNDPVVGRISFAVAADAVSYFDYFEKQSPFNGGAINVTILRPPEHGRLIGGDTYIADPDFHGQDKIEALVELGGRQVKVVYFINVVDTGQRVGDDEASIKKYCGPKGDMWKISLPSTNNWGQTAIDRLASQMGVPHVRNRV